MQKTEAEKFCADVVFKLMVDSKYPQATANVTPEGVTMQFVDGSKIKVSVKNK